MAKFTMDITEKSKKFYLSSLGRYVTVKLGQEFDDTASIGKLLVDNYGEYVKYAGEKSKFDDLVNMPSASEVNAVAGTINPLLAPIHKLFRESANGINNNVKYAVVGDSTRDNSFNEMISYYIEQLDKINVTLFDNAESGQSGYDWAYNVDQTTLSQLLTDIGTNEANYIVEFSHGINDYKNGATQSDVKSWLTYGLTQLKDAKPNVNIVLVTPIITGDTERNTVLKTIYQELSTELNLPLVDATLATEYGVIHGNTDYYQDSTHPNKFGSRRIVDYIMNAILPIDLLSIMTIEPYIISSTTSLLLPAVVQEGFYVSDGSFSANSDWRSLELIDVEPNFVLEVTHQGDRNDAVFYDQNDVFISRIFDNTNTPTRIFTIPANAWKVGINITSDATTWLALNDTPSVQYQDTSENLYLNIDAIHAGLKIRNTKERTFNGSLVDDYGSIGASGQSLTIDSNNKMKWQ